MADPRYSGFPFPTFQPAYRCILTISQSNPVVITTTFDGTTPGQHQYLTGLIVRLDIPLGWGMGHLNEVLGPITVTSPTQFTMNIDTTNFPPLVVPSLSTTTTNPAFLYTAPQVTPVGEVNDQLISSTQNVLPYPLVNRVE